MVVANGANALRSVGGLCGIGAVGILDIEAFALVIGPVARYIADFVHIYGNIAVADEGHPVKGFDAFVGGGAVLAEHKPVLAELKIVEEAVKIHHGATVVNSALARSATTVEGFVIVGFAVEIKLENVSAFARPCSVKVGSQNAGGFLVPVIVIAFAVIAVIVVVAVAAARSKRKHQNKRKQKCGYFAEFIYIFLLSCPFGF